MGFCWESFPVGRCWSGENARETCGRSFQRAVVRLTALSSVLSAVTEELRRNELGTCRGRGKAAESSKATYLLSLIKGTARMGHSVAKAWSCALKKTSPDVCGRSFQLASVRWTGLISVRRPVANFRGNGARNVAPRRI